MSKRVELLIGFFLLLPLFDVLHAQWPKIAFIWRALANWRLLLLLTCLPCGAQFGGFTDQPYLAALPVSDGLPPGIGWRWKSSALSTGLVSIWTDSIRGYNLAQSASGNRPTNDVNGVTFAASKWLDATNLALVCSSSSSAKDCFMVIVKFDAVTEQYILGENLGGAYAGLSTLTRWYNPNAPWGLTATGQWIDFLYAGKSGTVYQTYTNGVVGNSTTTGSYYDSTVVKVGSLSGNNANFKGQLKEFIVWTNVVGFDSTAVSNIHYYATNTYGFSP